MITKGQVFPEATFKTLTQEGVKELNTPDFLKGKTVALFGVPGAFTPTCSNAHFPSFLKNVEALKEKGVDAVFCVTPNDVFVNQAWQKSLESEGKITILSDGSLNFTKKAGLELDLSQAGLGVRSKRYSMLIKDGIVEAFFEEEQAGQCTISSCDALLDAVF